MKTLLSVPALLLLVTAGSAGAEEFLISYWHGPPPNEERFAEIAEANFNVAMGRGGRAGYQT